jgi:translocation and assembly module TamB
MAPLLIRSHWVSRILGAVADRASRPPGRNPGGARLRWAGLIVLSLVLLPLVALRAPGRAAEEDKGVLADLISKALSTPSTNVSIGAVEGVLSSDASISNIVLSDRNGPWLKIDKVRLVWSRLALLKRRLEVDELTIGHLDFLRRPLPSQAAPPPAGAASQSILPELPVKVIVKRFAVQELTLGEPVIGVAARLDLAGRMTLGPPSEGLDLRLTSKRLDAPGAFSALLTYVPATDRLTLDVHSSEPAGGLFVHLVNLPGLPPAKLALEGAGPLDKFAAKLDFAAGADVWARGNVVVARQVAGRELTLDLNSRLEGLAPAIVRPVLAGETTLKGALLFNDDSSIALPGGLHLVSASARLDFEGGKSADGQLALKVHAGAIPGATAIGKLDLNASIMGPVSGPKVEGAFDAGQIHVAQGSVDHVAATFRANPTGPLTEAATRIPFEGRAEVSGLSLADPALRQAVGPEVTLALRGSAEPSGEATFDRLELATPNLKAHYAGLLGATKVAGKLDAAVRDLSRFALLAGRPLKGEAAIVAELDGAPRSGALGARLDAHASHLESGSPILDRVLGGELALSGDARSLAGGGFGFSNLTATGKHGSARLDGAFAPDKVNLDASVDVPQAQVLDPRVTGKATAVAALTGSLNHLDGTLKASLDKGQLLDRPTSGLTLEARAKNLTRLLDASVSLGGDVDRQPLEGAAHVAKHADGSLAVDKLTLSLASARLAGELAISADQLANGALTFNAKNLDDLSPLVLTKLSGSLQARVTASAAGGRQQASIAADSARLGVGAAKVEGLEVDLTVADLWGAKAVSGLARLSRAEIAGQSMADIRLTATAQGDASDLDFSGTARGIAIKARGRLTGGSPVRLELASLAAQKGGHRIALAGPATLAFGRDGVDIETFALGIDAGRLSVAGHAGSSLDLRANSAGLPLAALDLLAPGLGLAGFADGEATVKGTPDAPSGDWRLQLRKLSAPQTRSAALPALDIDGSGRLAGGRTSLDVAVHAGPQNALRLTGSAPLAADGALDLKIDGRLDAGLANVSLSVTGQRLTGALTVALQVRGTVMKPLTEGSIRLSNGEFRDDETGFKLAAISGAFVAVGDVVRIDRLTGSTPNGGSIAASGEVRLDPAAGFPGSIRLVSRRAALVSTDVVAATADLDLTISGPLARKPDLSGRVAIDSMDITVPDSFDSVSAPIPGTKHVNPTPTARAVLAYRARVGAPAAGAPFDATLALTISAPGRIVIRGRGIHAEVGGDLQVRGPARDPQVIGGFHLLRGSLSLLGKRLVFTRGQLRFHGDLTPELDLVAETTAADITARIEVSGPATRPLFSFTSDPSLPQDEILSRILFQNASGNLSAFQAIQLANAVASLTGRGDAFEQLRRSLGVDSLDIGSSANGGPTVGISRAINDRISVRATTGARAQDNGVSVDLDVTRHIRLQAGVDASGGSNVGAAAEWEFK